MIASIAPKPRSITLELDPGGPPISGRLSASADPARPFIGWIGLLAALEATIGPDGARAAERATSGRNEQGGRDA
jgi:hypothetical protein